MGKARNAVVILGLLIGISNSIVLYLSFLFAYFNDYVFSVNINNFGEAQVEFIVLPLALLLFIYAGTCCIKKEVTV